MKPIRKIRVLIDMDGVIADLDRHQLDIYRQENPDYPFIPLTERNVWSGQTHHQFSEKFGQKYGDTLWEIVLRKNFFRTIPAVKPAIENIKILMENELYEIFFCTSPCRGNPHSASEKIEWIAEHFGDFYTRKMIITQDKTVVRGDFLIDDKHQVKGSDVPSWRHVLARTYHNQHLNKDTHPLILENWSDLENILKS